MIWRAYEVQIPKALADRLDKAIDRQSHNENRVVGLSEFLCWAILLGLNAIDEEVQDGQAAGPDAGGDDEHDRGGADGQGAP